MLIEFFPSAENVNSHMQKDIPPCISNCDILATSESIAACLAICPLGTEHEE